MVPTVTAEPVVCDGQPSPQSTTVIGKLGVQIEKDRERQKKIDNGR
jgi:hypothetical protein